MERRLLQRSVCILPECFLVKELVLFSRNNFFTEILPNVWPIEMKTKQKRYNNVEIYTRNTHAKANQHLIPTYEHRQDNLYVSGSLCLASLSVFFFFVYYFLRERFIN